VREAVGADAGDRESTRGRQGLKVRCGGEARGKFLAHKDVDRLLQLRVVMEQERLLHGGVGESEAQSCIGGACFAAHQPGVDPLDDATLEADHGKRQ